MRTAPGTPWLLREFLFYRRGLTPRSARKRLGLGRQCVWPFPLGGGQGEGADLNPSSSGSSKGPLEGCDIEAVGGPSQLADLG